MVRKIALVGVGKIARDQHIPAIAASSDWQLAAAVSRNASVEGVPNYADFDEMLEKHPEIEIVSLCMPPVPRYPFAEKALKAGRHVMLEKPPGASVSEVYALEAMAIESGLTIFATWHSREAAHVATAKAWLVGKEVERFKVTWKEDVRKWHPGQEWVFEPGGMGIFDPGINALSIVTEILPDPIHLTSAVLDFPENRDTPIAANLTFSHPSCSDVTAELNWDHSGADIWDIDIATKTGTLTLKNGGAVMLLDGVMQGDSNSGLSGEYPRLYATMAELISRGKSDMDLGPMLHVADAMTLGKRRLVAPFHF